MTVPRMKIVTIDKAYENVFTCPNCGHDHFHVYLEISGDEEPVEVLDEMNYFECSRCHTKFFLEVHK